MTPGFQRTGLFVVAAVVVVLAGAAGAFFGLLATVLYEGFGMRTEVALPAGLGPVIGGLGGVAVAVLWSSGMMRLSAAWAGQSLRRGRSVLGTGSLFGLFAGIASSLVLHAGLQAAAGHLQLDMFLVGLGFGIPAGLLVGVLGSLLWLGALPKPPPAAPEE